MSGVGPIPLLVLHDGFKYSPATEGTATYVKDNRQLIVQPDSWRRIELNNGYSSYYRGLHLGLIVSGPTKTDSADERDKSRLKEEYIAELNNLKFELQKNIVPYGICIRSLSRVPPNGNEIRIPEVLLEWPIGTNKQKIHRTILTTQEQLFNLMLRYLA
ncbi:hypothetical protein HYX04_04270 [Candidatus Woesearchaeota archaeon]|nr:hypothetical protein [Candidatus Woesearchaeota archaeon]